MNLKCSAQRVLIIVYTLAISIHQSQYRTHFIFSKRFPFVSLQSITPSNKAALICFLLLCISFVCSRTSYKWIRAVYILSCLAFLAGHNVFEIHSCCCVDLQFLSFPSSVLSWEYATVCLLIAIPMSCRQPSWRPSPLGTGRGSLSERLWGRPLAALLGQPSLLTIFRGHIWRKSWRIYLSLEAYGNLGANSCLKFSTVKDL